MSRYIVTADNHLRFDPPICRLDDDWLAFQQKALLDIVSKANEYECDLIIVGDLFDSYAVHSVIVSMFIDSMSALLGRCHIIGGNHTLKYHREENISESSIGIIKAIAGDNTGKIRYYTCQEESIEGRFEHSYRLDDDITLVHTLVFPNEDAIPFGAKGVAPEYLLEKFDTPWIFTGDMHHNFVYENGGRRVINPGCMAIQNADELDYIPGVYYVDTGDKIDVSTLADKHKPVYRISNFEIAFIPIFNDTTMVTRNHLERNQKRDARMEAFVELIQLGRNVKLSFMDNLAETLKKTLTSEEVDSIFDELKEESHGV
jgi:DNA repair exonuclease SbcCD nuclease subunit